MYKATPINDMFLVTRPHAWVAVESRSSVVRAPAAKVGGSGFNSQWLP